ncbi:MAG: abortive phage infection protein, partial [Pseudomonadota bacterium]
MSKLHVTQIGGYLRSTLGGIIPMDDVAKHSDTAHVDKVFLTRALTALAISHLADVKAEDLSSSITDGTDDGGIDGIYFDPNERTLYLVQTKWHEDGNGSIELGDTLKFINGVSSVLNNELSSFNARIKARQSDIQSALYDASSKFVLVIAHTGQQALAGPVSEALQRYVDSQNDTSELMKLAVLGQG